MPGVTRKDVAALTEPPIAQESAKAVKAKAPKPASFGICEGTRDELERTGKATDPFSGRALTKDDLK